MEERPPPRLKKAHRRRFQSEPPVEALESLFTFAREDSDHTLEQANLDTNDAEGNMVTILEGRQHRRERSSQIPTGWDKLKGPAMERVKKDRHRRQGSDVPTGFDELPAHRRQRSSVPSGVDELPERERTPTNNRHRRNRSSVPTGLEGLPAMSPITSMFDEEMPLKQPSRPRVGSRYMNLAKRVNALKSTGKLSSIKDMYATEASVKDIFAKEDENEPSKEGAGMFGTKNADNQDAPTSHTDNLLDSALNLNQLFEEGDKISIADTASSVSDEMLPLTSADVNNGGSAYGSISGSGSRKKKKKKVRMAQLSQFWCLPRSRFGLAEIIHPKACMRGIDRFLRASSFTYVAVPSLLMAALVYYHLGNPSLNFLPGDATVSWWLIFIARQALTLELAIAVEYFAVEGLALRTKWMVYMCGPLVTLWFINAKGWPLVAILWSLNDLVLLHGNSPFQQNWFFFLDIGVFSEVNKGGDFLYSEFYLRFLMSMLLGGTCHAIKRTHVAMTFGKRTLQTYKASMETILADIVLISEVAELARELEYESANSPGVKPSFRKSSAQNKWKDTLDVNYQVGIDTKDTKEILGDDRKSIEDAESSQSSLDIDYESDLDDDESDSDGEEEEDDDDEEDDIGDEQGSGDGLSNSVTFNETIGQVNFEPAGSAMDASVFSSGRTTGELKRKLDRWQEPKNKLDKSVDASIADILKFRRALTYMDDPYPFGDSFGQGATRNECIKSAQKTYRRLIRSANQSVLSYDVIKLLAVTDDGDLEEVKDLRLRRLFRPTRLNELSLLAFVQTCDTVYKKLRYFRASVGNSSVINKVLESIVDSIVNFVLALVILTILQYNPYPILVSLSTIMVSLAFAMGPSASKYIEVSTCARTTHATASFSNSSYRASF
jgi:hypothetical protein